MLIDLHCHTTRSQDSRLVPTDAVDAARRSGLDALCLTEHDTLWSPDEVGALSRETGFPVLAGVEVSTEIGHVLAFGLPDFDLELRRFASLVTRARDYGAALVLAHPFRRHFRFEVPVSVLSADVERAMRRRALGEVAALETGNGGTRMIENSLAARVAERLGKPAIAGSDAHAPDRVGLWATEVDGWAQDGPELASTIHRGQVRAVVRRKEVT